MRLSHEARRTRPGLEWLAWLALFVLPAATAAVLGPPDRVRIEIDGVDRPIADNVRAYLSLTRYVQRTDLTDGQVRRLADRAVDEAVDALRPFGYYEPVVKSRTTRDDDRWIVRLRIKPGEPVLMREVQVEIVGEGRTDPEIDQVVKSTSLRTGTRLEHAAYEKLKTDLVRTALARGYLDAKLTRRDLAVDPAMHTADALLTLDTGGRYEFGKVTIEQDVIDPALLEGFVRFAEGQPYSPERIRNTQFALEDSYYFSTVTVTPGERDPTTLTVPITIHAERIKRDRYTASVGYGTDTGPRGQFSWDRRLVNTSGHRFRLDTTVSSVMQEAVARYIIPVGDPTLEKLMFSGGYTNEELGGLTSERWELVGSLTHAIGNWQRVLFLKLNQETTVFPTGPDERALLLIPGISFSSMQPNFVTGFVRDAAYYFELSGSPATLGSDASYLRFYARGERVWRFGASPWSLRLRGQVGTSWVDDFSELPASQRFFAGGDNSVRGFALDSLSPQDPDAPPGSGNKGIGGEHMVAGTIQFERDFPRSLVGVAFYDTGNAFDDWGTPLEYSVGVGIRYRLPMLMLGFDVAQALSESGKSPRLHLSITQVLQ
jgi:translocation and assembly module TamA